MIAREEERTSSEKTLGLRAERNLGKKKKTVGIHEFPSRKKGKSEVSSSWEKPTWGPHGGEQDRDLHLLSKKILRGRKTMHYERSSRTTCRLGKATELLGQ